MGVAREIPHAYRDEIKETLGNMVVDQIIEPLKDGRVGGAYFSYSVHLKLRPWNIGHKRRYKTAAGDIIGTICTAYFVSVSAMEIQF